MDDDTKFVSTTQAVVILDEATPIEVGGQAVADTVAVYLPEIGALILRHSARGAIPTETRRAAVFVESHAEAVRAAVKATDRWIAQVKKALGSQQRT